MKSRIDVFRTAPKAVQAMMGLQSYVNGSGIDRTLLTLLMMRVSQINGCAFCLDMHSKEARAAGETEQRLYLLDAWREVSIYSERERAALAWAESVTLVSESRVPDAVFEEAKNHFSDDELANLTVAVVAINGWNRLAISFRAEAGSYRVGMLQHG